MVCSVWLKGAALYSLCVRAEGVHGADDVDMATGSWRPGRGDRVMRWCKAIIRMVWAHPMEVRSDRDDVVSVRRVDGNGGRRCRLQADAVSTRASEDV